MNTPEHMIFAKPDVWCSNASPGGGTYGVSSSNDFARAIRAALVGSGSCNAAVLTARATITGTSESLIMTISCDGIHQEATSKVTRAAQVSEGQKTARAIGPTPAMVRLPNSLWINSRGFRARLTG